MLAVDSSVVVRLLVNDDERQSAQARHVFETDEIWISATVLLETAWVLESVYELSIAEIAKALRNLLGPPNVRVEDAAVVAAALEASAKSLDLADAMHVLRAPEGAQFVSFDRELVKAGRRLRRVRLP